MPEFRWPKKVRMIGSINSPHPRLDGSYNFSSITEENVTYQLQTFTVFFSTNPGSNSFIFQTMPIGARTIVTLKISKTIQYFAAIGSLIKVPLPCQDSTVVRLWNCHTQCLRQQYDYKLSELFIIHIGIIINVAAK